MADGTITYWTGYNLPVARLDVSSGSHNPLRAGLEVGEFIVSGNYSPGGVRLTIPRFDQLHWAEATENGLGGLLPLSYITKITAPQIATVWMYNIKGIELKATDSLLAYSFRYIAIGC